MVLLSTEGLQLRSGTHKLTGRYIGPFRVMGSVNDNAVTAGAAATARRAASHLQHLASQAVPRWPVLIPWSTAAAAQPPAVQTDTNGVASYEVECVWRSVVASARRELLVRWKGYGAEHDEWQRRSS